LKREIKELENKPNRTLQEERELENKRKELKYLGEKNNNFPPFNYKPLLIGGGCLLIILLISAIAIYRKKKR
jgi:hypothetical protein